MYKKHLLPNGLRVITMPMEGTETVTVMVSIGAGSRYEDKREQGLAHFLEHLAFKGTKKRPTALDISRTLEAVGAEYNAFTSKETISFYVKVDRKHATLALDVIGDMLAHALLDPKEIEREKGVIIEEMHMYQDTPMRYVGDLFEELLYGGAHPLGRFIIGMERTIRSFSREDFLHYQESLYQASNIVVAVAGRLDHAVTLKQVARYFGKIPRGKVRPWKKVEHAIPYGRVRLFFKDTDQTHLVVGVPAYPLTSPRRYAASLLAVILGGGMSSRLFVAVRERGGLAYYVRAGTDEYRDTGYLAASAGVTNAKVEEALSKILEEFQKTRDRLIPQAELQKAKDYVKGRTIMSLESSDEVASWGAMQEILEGKIRTVREVFRKVDAVTPGQIREVAQDLFRPQSLALAMVGPFQERESPRFEKLLVL